METGLESPAAAPQERNAGRKYPRAARIAAIGAILIVIVYCGALVAFSILGSRAFPAGDFTMLITLPPRSMDKFWHTTFGGRNVEVSSTEEMGRALWEKIERNIASHGESWRFDRIFIVGHGGPGYLIFELGGAKFGVDDIDTFSIVRGFADADTEIVIRCCSMLKEKRGFVFIQTLAATANCKVRAWTNSGMYNGLVQLGDEYLAHPDGRVERIVE